MSSSLWEDSPEASTQAAYRGISSYRRSPPNDADTSIKERFASRIGIIVRPPGPNTATLRGAGQYGLSKRQLVSSVIALRSYMIKVCSFLISNPIFDPPCRLKVKLPVEQEDFLKRPAYIVKNDAGATICHNGHVLYQLSTNLD